MKSEVNNSLNESLLKEPLVLFPIDDAIVSHYSLSGCPICGEKSFHAWDNGNYLFFCPRCGRFIIGDSGIHYAFRDNLNCYASKCFNFLLKKHNNMFYVHLNKTPIFYDVSYDSKKLPKELYEYYSYEYFLEEYKNADDIERKMHYILESLDLSLPNIQSSEFIIPSKTNRLLRTIFFIDDRNTPEKTLKTYIDYLIDDQAIELIREDDDGKVYKLTRQGRKLAKNASKQKTGILPSQITVEGDFVAGDKDDFSGSTYFGSIIKPKGKSSNKVEMSSVKEKKEKWGIGKGVIASLIATAILAIVGLILKNWDSIVAIFNK
jgi:predicted transcriptional regulator